MTKRKILNSGFDNARTIISHLYNLLPKHHLYTDQIVLDDYLDLKWDTFNSFKLAEPDGGFMALDFANKINNMTSQ